MYFTDPFSDSEFYQVPQLNEKQFPILIFLIYPHLISMSWSPICVSHAFQTTKFTFTETTNSMETSIILKIKLEFGWWWTKRVVRIKKKSMKMHYNVQEVLLLILMDQHNPQTSSCSSEISCKILNPTNCTNEINTKSENLFSMTARHCSAWHTLLYRNRLLQSCQNWRMQL